MNDKELEEYLNSMRDYVTKLKSGEITPQESINNLVKAGICNSNGELAEPYSLSLETGKILFENGSEIHILPNVGETIRSKIKTVSIEPVHKEYDYIKNIKHLIERYKNKQNSLSIKYSEYGEGVYDGLERAIDDLTDILNGLEV